MRTFILTMLAFIAAGNLYSQGLQLATYVEYTHVSPKAGVSLGFAFADHIEVGGFYQRSTVDIQPPEGRPLCAEKNFAGAYVGLPLLVKEKTSLSFSIRTGITNGDNFTITPDLKARYRPIGPISVGAGVGIRSFRPTALFSICFNLNNHGDTLN